MHRNAPRLLFGNAEEFINNLIRRRAAIDKEQICVLDPVLQKPIPIILNIVQANHMRHIQVFEDLNVVFGTIAPPVVLRVDRAHETDELARDCPVEVSVLDLFVVLVLDGVERAEVVPVVPDGEFQSLDAVENRAFVVAVPVGSVAERPYNVVVRLESIPGVFCVHLEHCYHERAHQVA